MRISRCLVPALCLAAVLAVVPARARAAENGEIVSVGKREFLARGLDRKGLDLLLEKDGKITEDELKHSEKEIQNKTDEYTKEIDTVLAHKEKEILSV